MYVDDKKKSIGRIRSFIFNKKKCVGYKIKRPDFLWMFHRKNYFIELNNTIIKQNGLYVKDKSKLVKENKISKEYLSILEMPVNFGKSNIGYIEEVSYDGKSGNLVCIGLSKGRIAGKILGKSQIKAQDIKGYSAKYQAIILNNNVSVYEEKKGLAENAGKATSYVIHKVKKTSPKVVDSMQKQSDKIHDMFNEFKEQIKEGMNEE